MPTDLELLTIEDLEMLLHLQRKKAARLVVAEETARQAEEEAKAKACKAVAVKKWKAAEVVGSDSDTEPAPLQKKAKGKAWAVSEKSAGKVEVAEMACQR
jgi:hypothetical protein